MCIECATIHLLPRAFTTARVSRLHRPRTCTRARRLGDPGLHDPQLLQHLGHTDVVEQQEPGVSRESPSLSLNLAAAIGRRLPRGGPLVHPAEITPRRPHPQRAGRHVLSSGAHARTCRCSPCACVSNTDGVALHGCLQRRGVVECCPSQRRQCVKHRQLGRQWIQKQRGI